MDDLNTLLAEIGFRRPRREPECWQATRVSRPAHSAIEPQYGEPARSRALLAWLDRLRDRRRPSPYHIGLAMHMAAAEDRLGRRLR